mgnify:CR=1 FL=1
MLMEMCMKECSKQTKSMEKAHIPAVMDNK